MPPRTQSRPILIPPPLAARMACGAGWTGEDESATTPVRAGRTTAGRDGAVEAVATLLATVLFGLGWALVELSAPGRPPTSQAASLYAPGAPSGTAASPGALGAGTRLARRAERPQAPGRAGRGMMEGATWDAGRWASSTR